MSHELPREHTVAGDSHRFECTVLDDGEPMGIETAELSWHLFERGYDRDPDDAVLSDGDASVTIDTDPITDPSKGEFQVRVEEGATDGLSGMFHQRFVVDPPDATKATWVGKVVVEQ